MLVVMVIMACTSLLWPAPKMKSYCRSRPLILENPKTNWNAPAGHCWFINAKKRIPKNKKYIGLSNLIGKETFYFPNFNSMQSVIWFPCKRNCVPIAAAESLDFPDEKAELVAWLSNGNHILLYDHKTFAISFSSLKFLPKHSSPKSLEPDLDLERSCWTSCSHVLALVTPYHHHYHHHNHHHHDLM